MEYSDERGLFHLNLMGKKDGFKVTKSLPSCIQDKNSIDAEVSSLVYDDAKNMLKLLTFLSQNNRYYNYNFRENCLQTQNCSFQEPNKPFQQNIASKLVKSVMKITIKLIVVFYLITTVLDLTIGILQACKFRKQRKQDSLAKRLADILLFKPVQTSLSF
ncbi:Sulfatase [Hexamita inflata]|nr:Sulfatase [Hexamita inflata]